jgi:signal transduction histidine kinase
VGLDELGLAAAIEHCVEGWRRRLAPAQLLLSVDGRIDNLDEARHLALYRTVQEGLTNCARHAAATRIAVRIDWQEAEAGKPCRAVVRIEDNGAGADLSATNTGLGLIGMRERCAALGGELSVESPLRGGFRLMAHIPAAQMQPT